MPYSLCAAAQRHRGGSLQCSVRRVYSIAPRPPQALLAKTNPYRDWCSTLRDLMQQWRGVVD
ncbi:MAG: hypothetical protein IJV22_07505 [Bacteroidales bacterium]|nr:hypothetical protein [Bacteroidales bacterium]